MQEERKPERRTKKIVFCLPGNEFTRHFFESWIVFSEWLYKQQNIEFFVRTAGGSNVSKVRERCLRPFKEGSTHPKIPFYGEFDYDYIMWIDSDIVFQPSHFQKLLEDDLDIVAGLYNNGAGDFVCQIDDSIPMSEQIGKPVEVFWVGFGFVLIKKGVFENVEPPWFQTTTIDTHDRKDVFATEDIYFCYKARQSGFKIYVDPEVVVGHFKGAVI